MTAAGDAIPGPGRGRWTKHGFGYGGDLWADEFQLRTELKNLGIAQVPWFKQVGSLCAGGDGFDVLMFDRWWKVSNPAPIVPDFCT